MRPEPIGMPKTFGEWAWAAVVFTVFGLFGWTFFFGMFGLTAGLMFALFFLVFLFN